MDRNKIQKRNRCLFLRLKRAVGENPTRSRHCKCERAVDSHCMKIWEGAVSVDHKPGNLPVFVHQIYLRG